MNFLEANRYEQRFKETNVGAAEAREAFKEWYNSLPLYSGFPAKGTIAGALVILDRLQENFDLSIDSHTAKGGAQISGASGIAVRSILKRFDEHRPFLHEGGRTNRGLRGEIKRLLEAIDGAGLDLLSTTARNNILAQLQAVLIEKVREYHELQRLEVSYDPAKSTWQFISDLLDVARQSGKDAPVAQYLVGAKLQLRFPQIEVSNESFSTADVQLGRFGDFCIGNTIFHVTVGPTPALYEKCKRNLVEGLRVYLLVRDRDVVGTKQNAENTALGQIVVQSIETFVGQNLDELGTFSNDGRTRELGELLALYNRRVNAIEMNKSLMIDLPANLR